MNSNQLATIFVGRTDTIEHCLSKIDKNGKGIVLVVTEDHQLLGTITDGDIRRAILRHESLQQSAEELIGTTSSKPRTVAIGTSPQEMLKLMREHGVRHLPILAEGKVVQLITLSDLVKESEEVPNAVIMAGGFGTRLRPLTQDIPKPMLPVGDQPIMQQIIARLRTAGIQQVNVTTHYLPERIKEHFGDGADFGVSIDYISEESPLGTAGSIAQVPYSEKPLLVVNGDVLTGLDFKALAEFHAEQEADITIGVRQLEMKIPYGVVKTDGQLVREITEKPTYQYFVNTGIYLLSPKAHMLIPPGKRTDMPDFINELLDQGLRVASFPVLEYWIDIGTPDDYERANESIRQHQSDA